MLDRDDGTPDRPSCKYSMRAWEWLRASLGPRGLLSAPWGSGTSSLSASMHSVAGWVPAVSNRIVSATLYSGRSVANRGSDTASWGQGDTEHRI